MSQSSLCLNCDSIISQKFCPNCGQKTDTHRITFKHFIFHDILHGVWHFEKGILFSLKEAITRPGKAALNYISGKRIRYYNVFYLILLLIGLNLFMNSYYTKLSHEYFNTIIKSNTEQGKSVDAFFEHYSKLIIFSFVPLFAINSFLLFRRKKFNISEHFIIAGMVFLGVMVIVTFTNLFFFTEFFNYIDFLSDVMNAFTPIALFVFIAVSYFKTFKDDYSKFRTFLKTLFFLFLLLFELIVLALIFVGYFSNWTYKFSYGSG